MTRPNIYADAGRRGADNLAAAERRCRPDDFPPYPPMAHPSPRTHAHIADPDKYRALRARILGMVEPS